MAVPLRYNVRNLLVRRVSTGMTIFGIALVVFTFVSMMALARGLEGTLTESGSPENAVVLRRGALAEAASSITVEQFGILRCFPELATDGSGGTLASPELAVQLLLERKGGMKANVLIRGVRPVAFRVHDKVRLASGRMPAPRAGQLLVGRAAAAQFKGLAPGDRLRFGRREWPVVGTFAADGSAFESELWADADDLLADLRRDYFNSVSLRLREPSRLGSFARRLEGDPRLTVDVRSEVDYYNEQAERTQWMKILGLLVAGMMAVGAVFAAMNTMYAAIGMRTKEIGTLRALGFSRRSILASFLAESVLIAIPGGLLGCLLALPFDGLRSSTVNFSSFTELLFEFRITPAICLEGMLFAVVMGAIGGFLPARRAATLPILSALREL